MAVLKEENLGVIEDTAPTPVLFLEALSGMMGAVQEGKDKLQKDETEKQSFFKLLRSNGYSASQAFDIVHAQKPAREAGLPAEYGVDELKKRTDLVKSSEQARKAGLEADKLQHEKDTGYVKPDAELTANQADENKRNKSAVVNLIRTGQYFDSEKNRTTRVKSKEEMTSYLVEKFPGKVDFDDPDVQKAFSERYPSKAERTGIVENLVKAGKGVITEASMGGGFIDRVADLAKKFLRPQAADIKIRAKKSGRTFTTTKEKADEAIASGLFEEAK